MSLTKLYVDFENVGSPGLTGASGLRDGDVVNILYSAANDKLRFEEIEELMHSAASVNFIKVKNGIQNALDFQLITLLYLEQKKEEKGDEYIIISKDTGYDVSTDIAKKHGSSPVYRIPSVKSLITARKKIDAKKRAEEADSTETDGCAPAEAGDESWGFRTKDFIAPDEGVPAEPADEPMADDGDWGLEAMFEDIVFLDAPIEEEDVLDMPDNGMTDVCCSNDSEDAENGAETACRSNGDFLGVASLLNDIRENGLPAEETSQQDEGKTTKRLRWKRIKQFLNENNVYLDNDSCKFISLALTNARNKMSFYQEYVKKYGQKNGVSKYNIIKGYYDRLKDI